MPTRRSTGVSIYRTNYTAVYDTTAESDQPSIAPIGPCSTLMSVVTIARRFAIHLRWPYNQN